MKSFQSLINEKRNEAGKYRESLLEALELAGFKRESGASAYYSMAVEGFGIRADYFIFDQNRVRVTMRYQSRLTKNKVEQELVFVSNLNDLDRSKLCDCFLESTMRSLVNLMAENGVF